MLLAAGTAAAVDDVSLQLDRLNWQGWLLEGVELTLNLSAGGEPVFSARAETALHAASSTLLTALEATCSAGAVSAEAVDCSRGRLSLQHGELGRLDADFTLVARQGFSDVGFTLDRLGEKENRVRLAGEWRGSAWRLALDARGLDTGFIYRVAEVLGAGVEGFVTGGRLKGRLEARGDASGPWSLDGSIAFDEVEFDTAGGEYAGAGLRGEWQGGFALGDGGTWRGEHALTLGAGALLTPYALFEPGPASITLKAGLMLDPAVGTLAISPFSYRHPGLLELDGELALALRPALTLASLDLRSGEVPLGPFFDGYLRPVIGAPLLRDMAVEGAARRRAFVDL